MTDPRGAGDNFDFNASQRQSRQRGATINPATTTGRGRARGAQDTGTVALAITGMAFYWLMPALMSRRRRRKAPGTTPPTR